MFHVFFRHKGRVTTTRALTNYRGPVSPKPPCQLSLWEETKVAWEKTHDFRQSNDSHSFHMKPTISDIITGPIAQNIQLTSLPPFQCYSSGEKFQ